MPMSLWGRFTSARSAASAPVLVWDAALDDDEVRTIAQGLPRDGDFAPAAALLERVGRDWARRVVAVTALGEVAALHPEWLWTWRVERPESPDPLVVMAAATVRAAWNARGAKQASLTSGREFADFHELLVEADRACLLATEAAADDPTPWVSWLRVCRGLGVSRAVFDARWDALCERDPAHRAGHDAALQYLCEKWRGSHADMYTFARRAAADAPDGSPLVILLVEAHIEYALRMNWDGETDDTDFWRAAARQTDLDTALDRYPVDAVPRHPSALSDHSALGYALARSQRWSELAARFEATDHRGFHLPWTYPGGRTFFEQAHAEATRGRPRR
ncbi:hypothetical protein [Embleya sp. NPDC005971]|uniref:hypothetical protein n=1 Tax=unclassified Embleya TaxID=2699296 RepID=UPI0033CA1E5C